MNQTINTRSIILDMLIEINEKKQYSHIILRNALKKYQYLSHEDRAFISRVVLGTVERRITLDYVIDSFSTVKTTKCKPVIRNILRMSIYQILYMEGTGDFAACNEAVKLAQDRGFRTLKGFVNGVLRNIARSASDIKWPEKSKDPIAYLSVTYSMPEWIVAKWRKDYGFEETEIMCKAQLAHRPLMIRCNTDKITPDLLAETLTARDIKVTRTPYLPYAMEIEGFDYLEKMPEFNEGLFFIQDLSSMMVGQVANPEKDYKVLDVCGAPGGKSVHIAQLLMGSGHVTARDISEPKVEMINENIQRLGLRNLHAEIGDARVLNPEDAKQYDLVIADLPCSGLGIMNKKPDIKYQASLEKNRELVALQREILAVAQEYVKPGGILLYSTCTVNPEENEENVDWLLSRYAFEPVDITDRLPKAFQTAASKKGILELLPGILPGENNGHEDLNFDGFFIAKLMRV